AGYRQPTLVNELDGARQLLEAAGVVCVIEQSTEDLSPVLEIILAWTVREGVTNVIRHSRARQCVIRLARDQGMVEVILLNDGALQEDQQDKRANQGSGLPGLQERVAALGGTMEACLLDRSGKKHFRLRVTLPLQMA
ncbi:MAG TPA: sensor histidine kinase, partial [Ktedonobacteraceae bacterium]